MERPDYERDTCRRRSDEVTLVQVNDFAADAIISQLLLLDSQDPNKVQYMAICLA